MSMSLTLMSPQSSKTLEVEWLDIQTLTGSLVIQQGHAPAYIVLKKYSAVTWLLTTGAQESIEVVQGFLEVRRDKVVLVQDRKAA